MTANNSVHLYTIVSKLALQLTILFCFAKSITFKRYMKQITNWSKMRKWSIQVKHSRFVSTWCALVETRYGTREILQSLPREGGKPELTKNLASLRSHPQSRESRRIRLTRTVGRQRPVVEKIVATPTPTPTHTCPTPPISPCPPAPVEPPRCGRGMLAVPSRCSIFRAFRYFPINRKARARAFARSLARSLARSRANRNKKKHVYTYMCRTRECLRAGAREREREGERARAYTRARRNIRARVNTRTRACTYTIAHAYSDKASNAKKSRDCKRGRARRRAGRRGTRGPRGWTVEREYK